MRRFPETTINLLVTVLLLVFLFGNHTYLVSARDNAYGHLSMKQDYVNNGSNLTKNTPYKLDVNNIIRAYLPRVVSLKRPELSEEKIYTFLQGPKSWEEGIPWSGEWCSEMAGGNSFGGFGCGLCCMANIYSTLSGYECSPLDMYEYAKTSSSYYPTGRSGAISWKDMEKTLKKTGFSCDLRRKPATYEEFRTQMKQAKSAVVLVSSYNDNKFWNVTAGHYVNIWLYRDNSQEVFLAEPGSPDSNRLWIPLRYIYDALKTSSEYQYLTVSSYTEVTNEWKWDAINDNWNPPENRNRL